MAHVIFWEKPGCQTNRKQSAALLAAGHTLEVRNLLTEPWTELRLLDFLADMPVREWFNPNAPQVKSGEIEPGLYDTTNALRALIATPILIRRPLLEIGNTCLAGFDPARLHAIGALPAECPPSADCSRPDGGCAN